MLIPKRREVDAFCGSPATLYQRLASILAPMLLLGVIAYLLIVWRTLPEQIPSHYNAAGEIDGYGGRGSLLVMPVFGLVMDLSLAIVGRFPRSWNAGVRITVLNRARAYRLIRDLMADLRLGTAVMFSGYGVYVASLPEHFSSWVLPCMLVPILLPLARYLIGLSRIR